MHQSTNVPQKNAITAACQMPDEVLSKMEKHV